MKEHWIPVDFKNERMVNQQAILLEAKANRERVEFYRDEHCMIREKVISTLPGEGRQAARGLYKLRTGKGKKR